MDDSRSYNNVGVSKRKRQNSESYLQNATISGKRMEMDHGQVDIRDMLSRSKLNEASHSSSIEDAQTFTNLHKTSSVHAESDSLQKNSENNELFNRSNVRVYDNRSVERPPLSELHVPSPDCHLIYSDERSESDVSSPSVSERALSLSDRELSPNCIDGSEQKINIKNYPPTFVPTHRYLTIEESSESMIVNTWSKFRDMAFNKKPISLNERPCTLPGIPWGKCSAFWKIICDKDSATLTYRNPDYLECHENLEPRMRAIILDWLIQVSSAYRLHRETYYLAMDYFDRYLSNTEPVSRQNLQLIGVTCLFMAAKIDEVYAPKAFDFAYVTDDLYTVADLVDMEEKILKCLRFRLTPVSIDYWVGLMLQYIYFYDSTTEDSLIIPRFPRNVFNQVAHLLDFACLDSKSLRYSYSELAASALTIILNKTIALIISGLSEGNVCNCVEWMSVYWTIILDACQFEKIDFENDLEQVDGTHVKQQHFISMDMYDMAQSRFKLIELSRVKNPINPPNLLTPSLSVEKNPVIADDCEPSCSYK